MKVEHLFLGIIGLVLGSGVDEARPAKRVRFVPLLQDGQLCVLQELRGLMLWDKVDYESLWSVCGIESKSYEEFKVFVSRVVAIRNMSIPVFVLSVNSPLSRKVLLEARLGIVGTKILKKLFESKRFTDESPTRLTQEDFESVIDAMMKNM